MQMPEGAIDLNPFFAALFPDTDFTREEDAAAAAAWVLDNREQVTAALREFIERGGAPDPVPRSELDDLL